MFRMLFQVHSVHLKLRADVEIQVLIKKEHESFVIPYRAKLVHGVASLNANAEFYISRASPSFEVIAMILYSGGKKFAGSCHLDLADWQQNVHNQMTSTLENSADSSAKIVFDFIYFSTKVEGQKGLMSTEELEGCKKQQLIKQMDEKYSTLTREHQRLNLEILNMKRENKELAEDQSMLAMQQAESSGAYEQQLQKKQMQFETTQSAVRKLKETVSKIEQVVNQLGQSDLKQRVNQLLNFKSED